MQDVRLEGTVELNLRGPLFNEKSKCALYSRILVVLSWYFISSIFFSLLKIAFSRWRPYKFCFNQLMCHYADWPLTWPVINEPY